ncbi:MAG: serine protease [Nitriliruptor sp.]|uniref:serine protease n=1 Tax=Nitriliruptor sp. TaxID=2448056 RepID=UPI0034A0057F
MTGEGDDPQHPSVDSPIPESTAGHESVAIVPPVPGEAPEDDLEGFSSPLSRLVASARTWLVIVVVIAMVVPAVAFLGDEWSFRRSAGEVVATLDGERSGAAAADTVLLVRSLGCSGRAGTGTAFVVQTDRGPALLTNRHVVEDARTVGVRALDGSTEVQVTGVRLSGTADVAVLEVADPSGLPPALSLQRGLPSTGQEVRLVGFPAATPFTAAGTVDVAEPQRLLLDLEVAPGASGSPVVASDGQVVGQVHAIASDGRGVATPTGRLLSAIDDARPAPSC